MNNYWYNQIRRANVSLLTKVAMWVLAVLRPVKMHKMWRNHSIEMQNKLNEEHLERFGWNAGWRRVSYE